MTTPLIICDNCGARWRLPEGFAGATSKCRQCGSAIDVARQRDGAGEGAPAAARPAAARPAVDRSKEAPRPVERASPAASAPASSRRERGRDADESNPRDARRQRRGGREPEKKGRSKLPFVIAGVVVLAIVIVIAATR